MNKSGLSIVALSFALLSSALTAQAAEETVKYIHTDALGSIVAVSDEAGNITERREYEPFGAQLTPVLADGPGYTGHVQDAVTGLTYMQQRYYDPQIGRFLSVDPVTAYGGDFRHFNRYPYAFNNPYRFTDPDGRRSRQDHQRKDWSSITAKSPGAAAQMATSAHAGNVAAPSRSPQGNNNSSGAPPYGVISSTQETGWSASSILTGDTTVTATGVAALGVGIKAEKASGPGNDKVSLVTPALGLSATGTVNLVTVGYRWSDQPMPVDVSMGGGIQGGYGLGGGIQLTFDPGGASIQISGGIGAGASFDVFGVGFKPGGGQ